ncbi:hypothetical protein Godav_004200 [Gossypium davidsonii]|uniref:Uncharacterized protein n=1 Tax=Gossypium davidsonii TaxID=34287 RepID=A0A7J8SLQ3_GOSDV|nr:hypothetical protein [Gossypium davidsonii]
MDPEHVQGVLNDKSSIVDNFVSMKEKKFQKYLIGIQMKTFIQEWGFKFPMNSGGNIWNLVCFHKWENFYKHPSELTCILVVQELYASLKYYEETWPVYGNYVWRHDLRMPQFPPIKCGPTQGENNDEEGDLEENKDEGSTNQGNTDESDSNYAKFLL